jgi:hypothetical protein
VAACSYNPATITEQIFTVNGTAALPSGVVNTNNISLAVIISVTVKGGDYYSVRVNYINSSTGAALPSETVYAQNLNNILIISLKGYRLQRSNRYRL